MCGKCMNASSAAVARALVVPLLLLERRTRVLLLPLRALRSVGLAVGVLVLVRVVVVVVVILVLFVVVLMQLVSTDEKAHRGTAG